MVDGVSTDANISELFADKYCGLYNSVSFTEHDMTETFTDMKTMYLCDDSVAARRCTENCLCKRLALVKIKLGKSDGNVGY